MRSAVPMSQYAAALGPEIPPAPAIGGAGHIHGSRGGSAPLLDSNAGLGSILCALRGLRLRRPSPQQAVQVSAAAPALGRLQLQEDGGLADPRNTTLSSAEPNKQNGQTRRVGHVNNTFCCYGRSQSVESAPTSSVLPIPTTSGERRESVDAPLHDGQFHSACKHGRDTYQREGYRLEGSTSRILPRCLARNARLWLRQTVLPRRRSRDGTWPRPGPAGHWPVRSGGSHRGTK